MADPPTFWSVRRCAARGGRRAVCRAAVGAGVAAGLLLLLGRPVRGQVPVRPPNPDVRATPPVTTSPTRADSVAARRAGEPPPVACRGQRVSDVVVLTQPPLGNRLLGRFKWIQRRASELHATTRESVVRRFLLLNPGDACDELRRSESERILRAQPFLVDARVRAYDDGRGGVRLEVETRDEFSIIVGGSAFRGRGAPPVSAVRLGEANLMGRGIYALGQWYHGGRGYTDGVVVRLTDYQLFGRPYQLALLGERRRVGGQWAADASHPFYTDLQRIAWRVSGGASDDYLELLRPDPIRNAMFYRRSYANVGGLVRVGVPGRLSLFGASLSFEDARTADRVQILSDSGPAPDGGPVLGFLPSARFPAERVTRANVLWGVRAVNFLRVTGFDALTGVQDVRRGFQAGMLLGRSVALLGSRDDDYFASGDLYAGTGSARSFVGTELHAEARHDNYLNAWRGLVGGGRAAWYLVPSDRWRFVTSTDFSVAERARVPVQLSLGERDGGVRGYRGAREAGSVRAVVRVESRYVLGPLGNVGDLGVATFADAGRLWAGDAPYGVSTPVRASFGAGVLGAFPRGSRRLWRMDVAHPVTRVPGTPVVQLIFENRDLTRLFWREPRDVQFGRERALSENIFSWP